MKAYHIHTTAKRKLV